ncbi:MAG: SIMPL domain-containing protein [Alphaproteobacteria bacterium]|nr:SIMPL domain-containing protein [Alphaproteobacteria bacterium]
MNYQNIAIGTLIATVIGAVGYRGIAVMKEQSSYITTNGLSDRNVVSDTAVCDLKIVVEGHTIQEAQEKMKKDYDKVIQFLTKEGITKEEIADTDSYIEDKYRWGNREKEKIARYEMSDTINIKSTRVTKIKELRSKLTELTSQGINITNNTRYYYKNFDKLRIEMMKEAAKDSENRAHNVAESVGATIAGIRNLKSGRFSISPEDSNYTNVDEWAEEHSIKKRIRVIVTGTFNLKR